MARTELDVESFRVAALTTKHAPPGMVDQQMRWNTEALLLCELIYCVREVRDALTAQAATLATMSTSLTAIKTATEGANTKLGAGINVHLF